MFNAPLADFDTSLETAIKEGRCFKAANIDELAKATGLANLAETVKTYDAMVAAKDDTEFYKREEFLWPVEDGSSEYYAFEYNPSAFNTFGGARTDANCRVLDVDFKPIDGTTLIPLALVLVLDLYFRLVPITMVPETPEIVELAQLIGITPAEVCQVMDIFQGFDPYLNRTTDTEGALYEACKAIWNRFGNDDPNPLASFAAQVKDYFK